MELTKIAYPTDKLAEEFDYPLRSWKLEEGHWTVHDKHKLLPSTENNPLFDIAEVYHVEHSSDEEGSDWILLAKAGSGYYVYIKAGCDYTGFSCRGGGDIGLEISWADLWNNIMDNDAREAVSRTQGWSSFQLKC